MVNTYKFHESSSRFEYVFIVVISLIQYLLSISYGKEKRGICLHVTLMMDVLNLYLHPKAHVFFYLKPNLNCTYIYIGVQIKLKAHSMNKLSINKVDSST